MERSPLSRGNEFRSGKTPYDILNASLKITQGTATIEDIRVEGPTVRLGLVGSASIPDRDLDLRGTASLVSTTPTPAFELPFMVQGAWDDPVMLPDAQSLIERSGAAQPLLDALRKGTARDAIRSAIEKFGVSLPAAPPQPTPPSAPETAGKPAESVEYAPAATETQPAPEPKAGETSEPAR